MTAFKHKRKTVASRHHSFILHTFRISLFDGYKGIVLNSCIYQDSKIKRVFRGETILIALQIWKVLLTACVGNLSQALFMHGSIWPVTIPPRAYPRGFEIFFFLRGLFPTPRHAKRDNSPPLSSWSTSYSYFWVHLFEINNNIINFRTIAKREVFITFINVF